MTWFHILLQAIEMEGGFRFMEIQSSFRRMLFTWRKYIAEWHSFKYMDPK